MSLLIISTPRLRLREFAAHDAAALAALNSDPEVLRHVLHPEPWSLAKAQQWLAEDDTYERYGFGRWAVTEKDSDELIGHCGLKYRPEQKHVDLGYRFAAKHWGKGYATEAARACLEYGFRELGLRRIVASYIPGNAASLHVLEKLGFQPCGNVAMNGKEFPLLEVFNPYTDVHLLQPLLIETERLQLRELHPGDARVMYALNSDYEVVKYTGDSSQFTSFHDDAKPFFKAYPQRYREQGFGRWAVILKSTGETLGWCGLKRIETGEVDLGYRFFRKHWGKGYATESSLEVLRYGFGKLGLQTIVGRARVENLPSIRVLEKCGMVYEKNFTDHDGECVQLTLDAPSFLHKTKKEA